MESPYSQPALPYLNIEPQGQDTSCVASGSANDIRPEDRVFHDWYRFVLSYPPHLVRHYIHDFGLDATCTVMDPFCGTGTTLVEAKRCGMGSIGLEANPFPCFASSVKTDWQIDPDVLWRGAKEVADDTLDRLRSQEIDDRILSDGDPASLRRLSPEASQMLIRNSISPLPLHKTLVLLDCLKMRQDKPDYRYGLLALGNALVVSIGNLRFGPEVGIGKPKKDVPVVAAWLAEVRKMVGDLSLVAGRPHPTSVVHMVDARDLQALAPHSIDAVITSPPYPNEKDYTRTTRLESVVLGFINSKAELQAYKKKLLRSNTRGVYKSDDDDQWIRDYPEIHQIAQKIEKRRLELGKTSGFEKLYSRVTRLYFGGMARHLAELRTILRPGARLAYVVGDQASYLRVMIRTGHLLADIAQTLGYELVRIDLFRTRFATATREELREEVVVLHWPGAERT